RPQGRAQPRTDHRSDRRAGDRRPCGQRRSCPGARTAGQRGRPLARGRRGAGPHVARSFMRPSLRGRRKGSDALREGPMEQARVTEAARILVQARRTGQKPKELPRECKPVTAEDSNEIIDEVSRQMGEGIAGWKITFLYKPREKAFRCPLFASRVFASPARIPQSLTPSLCIEPEVTFRLTGDLPARDKLYQAEEEAGAGEACPSFEVVDTRFDTSDRTIRQMLNEPATPVDAYADHITNVAFI